MSNHVFNKLKIIGTPEQIKEVKTFIQNDKLGIGTIDFNKITPMPKWVYGSSPDVKGIGQKDEHKWGKENTSLHWAKRNWNVKWNAYGQPDERNTEDTIYFQTAWSGVPVLIQKIAWIFPDITLEYSFADQDFGSSNCGKFRFKETKILGYVSCYNNSKEAYELSFELANNGEVPSEYVFNAEAYTYELVEANE